MNKNMKKATLVFSSFLLLIIGITLIASTVSQKLVSKPEFPEDYHMQIPKGRYEWNSKNLSMTSIGVGCVVVGVLFMTFYLLKCMKEKIKEG